VKFTNDSEEEKKDGRRKEKVTEAYQKLKEKRARDPEFDKEFKKRRAQQKATYEARKKEYFMGICTYLHRRFLIVVEELKAFKENWTTQNKNHPSTMPGFTIIDALLEKPKLHERYIKPQTYKFKSKPTSMHILDDIKDTDTFYHGITMQHMKEATFTNFLRGWLNMGDSGDPLEAPPYVVMNVACESATGLKKCMDGIPAALQTENVMVCQTQPGSSPLLTDVITPALTISRPHVDGYGRGQVLLEAYGTKLVLWWNDSPEVRKVFTELQGSKNVDYTWNAVKSWPGLKWTILHVGEYITMPPGTIRAVLSPVNSAVCSWNYIDESWMESGLLRDMLTWGLDLAEKIIMEIDETEEVPDVLLANMETEMKQWQDWIRHGKLEKDSKKKVQQLKNEIEKRVKELKMKISSKPK
jgi:hypothetical protein